MTNQNSPTSEPQDVQQISPIDTQANILFEAGLPARYFLTSPVMPSRAIGLPLIIAIAAIGAFIAILISGIISTRQFAQQPTPAAVAVLPTLVLTVTDTATGSLPFLKSALTPLLVTEAATASSTTAITATTVPTIAPPTVHPETTEAVLPPTNTPHPNPTDTPTEIATSTSAPTDLPTSSATSAVTVNATAAVTQVATMNTTRAATQVATMIATASTVLPAVAPSTALATAPTNSPTPLVTVTATDDPTCADAMALSLNALEKTPYTPSITTIELNSTKAIKSASYSDVTLASISESTVSSTPNADSSETIKFDTILLTKDVPASRSSSFSPKHTSLTLKSKSVKFIRFSIQLEGCNKNTEIFLSNAPTITLAVGSSIRIQSTDKIDVSSQVVNGNVIADFCMALVPDKSKSCSEKRLYVIFLAKANELSSISDANKSLPIYFVPVTDNKPDATLQITDVSAFKDAIFQQPKDAKGYVLIYAPASLMTPAPTATATVKPTAAAPAKSTAVSTAKN